MGAVGMLASSEVRRRWRSVVGLTLLVGVVGAVVLSTAAGARRSETALKRFNASSRSAELSLLLGFGYTPTPAQLSALRRLPDVAALAVVRFYGLVPVDAPATLHPAAAVDGAFGNVVDRSRLIAGRRADPGVADEVTIGEVLAAQLRQGVGGHLDFMSYSQAQFTAGGDGGPPPAPAGPRVRLRIVGIVRRPGDLGDQRAAGDVVVLTPAFNDAYFDRIGNFGVQVEVRTIHGARDVPTISAAARSIFAASGGLGLQSGLSDTQGAQSAIDVLALALWILAAVAALAGLVTIGIVLTRQVSLRSVDDEALWSLGLTRPQRVLTSGPAALLIATGGGLLAGVGAVAVSPLFPFGVARRAEPDVGVHVDWVVLAPGIIGIAIVVVAVAFVAAFRSTRRSALDTTSGARLRTSGIVETAARAGLAPTATNGLRMALEPGRGRAAVPVRSAYLGAVLGILGVTAVLVFASSLHKLVTTPRLYGSTWNFQSEDTNFDSSAPNACGPNDFGLSQEPGVGAIAAVCYNDIQLDGRPVIGWGFTPVRGTIEPEVVAGRAPRAPEEVALGSVTLHALGKSVGDTVQGRGPKRTVNYRIVGRVVFPTLGDPQGLADGAAFTGAGLADIFDSNSSSARFLLGDYAPGADRAAVARRIAAIPALTTPARASLPVEIDRLQRVGWLPATLAVLLAVLALLAVEHALVTSVSRRRRDLALLQALGFDRGQIRATIAWQATTIATVGLVIGLPGGIIAGHFAWRLVAEGLGVSTNAALPFTALLLTTTGVLALINLLAFFPARTVGHTSPAVALRSD